MSSDVAGVFDGNGIALEVPDGTDTTALVASFDTTGKSVSVGSVVQTSGMTVNSFATPVTYKVTAEDGSIKSYLVTVTVADPLIVHDATPPGALTINSVAVGSSHIDITWAASTDVDFDHALISCSSGSSLEVSSGQTVSVTGLASDTYYAVTLSAVDTSGNQSDGTVISLYTRTSGEAALAAIHTADELSAIRNDPDGGYILAADVDLAGYGDTAEGWAPIGDSTTPFTGKLYGGGYAISGLSINRPAAENQGMIGMMGDGGEIQGVVLESASVSGAYTVGSLVGYANTGSTIKNCSSTLCDVASVNAVSGGLVGEAFEATIADCSVSGTVAGAGNSGGLVGIIYGGTLHGCSSTCSVTSTGSYSGGLSSLINGTTVTDCSARGNVTGTSETGGFAGGMVGGTVGATISRCCAYGAVSGVSVVGGFAGRLDGILIAANCFARGSVTATSIYAGGFCGFGQDVTISNCYSTGATNGFMSAYGFIGYAYNGSRTGCYYDRQTSGMTGTNSGALAMTTAQMTTQATFSDWDFAGTWGMSGSTNGGYPYLLSLVP